MSWQETAKLTPNLSEDNGDYQKEKEGDGGMSWYLGVRGGTFTLESEQEANLLQFTGVTNLSMKKPTWFTEIS